MKYIYINKPANHFNYTRFNVLTSSIIAHIVASFIGILLGQWNFNLVTINNSSMFHIK